MTLNSSASPSILSGTGEAMGGLHGLFFAKLLTTFAGLVSLEQLSPRLPAPRIWYGIPNRLIELPLLDRPDIDAIHR